jgi:N4-gp56 family major capsid protein
MRDVGKRRMAEWWARFFDELLFIYLSGARGINAGFIPPVGYTGRANNAITAPDAGHLHVAGGKAKATLTTGDIMTLGEIDNTLAKAKMMGETTAGVPRIQPITIDGEKHYVTVMSIKQAQDMRIASGSLWLDVQKAAATALGNKSPIFKGGLGMYNNVVLHEHESVIRFSDYGSGANVPAARALFLGLQAGALSFGSPGTGLRYDWFEEARDNGNQIVISSNSIFGCKKVTYNGMDFGVMAIDTAAAVI